MIVDAIGVTEHDFVEPPLNRDKGISLEKLLGKAATYTLSEDEIATLASRLAALELQLTRAERHELDAVAGQPLKAIVRALVDAVDPDQVAAAQTLLVGEAARFTARDLAQLATAITHHLDPGADDRLAKDETAQHRQRCLTLSREGSGMTFVQGLLTKECGAALRTVIDAWSAPQPAADGTPLPASLRGRFVLPTRHAPE